MVTKPEHQPEYILPSDLCASGSEHTSPIMKPGNLDNNLFASDSEHTSAVMKRGFDISEDHDSNLTGFASASEHTSAVMKRGFGGVESSEDDDSNLTGLLENQLVGSVKRLRRNLPEPAQGKQENVFAASASSSSSVVLNDTGQPGGFARLKKSVREEMRPQGASTRQKAQSKRGLEVDEEASVGQAALLEVQPQKASTRKATKSKREPENGNEEALHGQDASLQPRPQKASTRNVAKRNPQLAASSQDTSNAKVPALKRRRQKASPKKSKEEYAQGNDEAFNEQVSGLLAWQAAHHNELPSHHRGKVEKKLCNFIMEQRKALRKGRLSDGRKLQLQSVPGMEVRLQKWSQGKASPFNDKVDAVERWVRANGCLPKRTSPDAEGKRHASFLNVLSRRVASMTPECRARLAQVPGMTERLRHWDSFSMRPFNDQVEELRRWVLANSRLPTRESSDAEQTKLGKFLGWQQEVHRKGQLPVERRERLESIPGMLQRIAGWDEIAEGSDESNGSDDAGDDSEWS